MTSSNHNRNYTAADIQQYLDGKMDAAAMHAFEKAAQEDPFLGDALEGMQEAAQQFGSQRITTDIQQLQTSLEERISQNDSKSPVVPIRPFRWWSVAAAILIIIVAGVFTFRNYWNREPSTQPIVLNDIKNKDSITKNPQPDTTPSETAIAADTKNFTLTQTEKNNPDKPIAADQPPHPETTSKQDLAKAEQVAIPPVSKDIPVLKKEEASASTVAAAPVRTEELKKAEATSIAGNNAPPTVFQNDADNAKANAGKNDYKGILINTDNSPLANASIKTSNQKQFTTDSKGNFAIPNEGAPLQVTVTSPGYQPRQFTLRNSANRSELQLQPVSAAQLDSVEIRDGGRKERVKSKSVAPKVMIQDAEPVSGWIEFEKYIEANKKDIQHIDSKSGEVVLSFIVNKEGTLSNFRVEQSLTEAQDKEAERLVKSGPAWHTLKDKKARVVVIIRF